MSIPPLSFPLKVLAGIRLVVGVSSWILPAHASRVFALLTLPPPTTITMRLFGARDAVLGGLLLTSRTPLERRRIVMAGLVADGADVLASLVGWEMGEQSPEVAGMVAGGASILVMLGLHLRRSALRLLSSQPSSFLVKPRSITSVSPSHLRIPRQSLAAPFQQRWASTEAEAKKDAEEAPISELQPTAAEEVENAIHEDNAAETTSQAASGSKENVEATADASTPTQQPSTISQAIDSATETVSNAASSVAQAASNAYRGTRGGTSVYQQADRSRNAPVHEPKTTIYIGNLFFDVTENDLVKELSRFGSITKCRLMRDSRGLSKGFGYVDFETIESATKAIEVLNQQLFEGRRLAVQYAAYTTKPDGDRTRNERPNKPLNPPSKTLFIGNMSFEMTDRDLNQLFRGIRNVIDVRVAIDRRTGQPRGFAHADFMDVKSAMEAMKVLEQKETYGRKLRIDYSYGSSAAPRTGGSDGAGGGSTYGGPGGGSNYRGDRGGGDGGSGSGSAAPPSSEQL